MALDKLKQLEGTTFLETELRSLTEEIRLRLGGYRTNCYEILIRLGPLQGTMD